MVNEKQLVMIKMSRDRLPWLTGFILFMSYSLGWTAYEALLADCILGIYSTPTLSWIQDGRYLCVGDFTTAFCDRRKNSLATSILVYLKLNLI